jgi:NAD(P)-dependent dehydrogenase (short-subunit alcohol dehydrogenase family)
LPLEGKMMLRTLRCDPGLLARDLQGRIYVVTGANSGAGFATMEQLVRQGAHVIAACRRLTAGEEAVASMLSHRGSAQVLELDLGSLASVRRFVQSFLDRYERLDGLVNNAGVMNTPEGRTVDGFETQFGINHLGHFLLTELLLDVLKTSEPSRIVCVSSVAHVGVRGRGGEIHLDDLNTERRPYDAIEAYSQSKLANVLHALDLARRLEGTGVTAVSVHPGWVRSNLVKHTAPTWVQNVLMRPFGRFLGMLSPEDGAQTTLHCLLDDDVPLHNGAYYSQNSILYPKRKDRPGGWPMPSPNPHAHDTRLAEQLREASLELVGLSVSRSTS